MGILGLKTFMEKQQLYEEVELSEIANQYRNKTNKEPVMLVDLGSVIQCFYRSKPTANIIAGELKKFVRELEKFTNHCRQCGISLKIFLDGKKPTYKYQYAVNHTLTLAKELEEVYSGKKKTLDKTVCRGILTEIAINFFLKQDICETLKAIQEADEEIFRYAKTQKQFAVLTNDTDFLFTDKIHYCLTLNNNYLKLKNYNKNKLANVLGIKTSQLPLFASVCQHYSFECSDLDIIYKRREIVNGPGKFLAVAGIIRRFNSDRELIQHFSELLQPLMMTYLEERLQFFCVNVDEDVRPPLPLGGSWEEIQILARKRHTAVKADGYILKLIEDGVLFLSFTWENIRKSLPVSELRTLRKKIYGIIFYENPIQKIFITEYTCFWPEDQDSPQAQVDTFTFDRVPHPGLRVLWSPETSTELKKKVFYGTINEKFIEEGTWRLPIPDKFVFPVFAAFYLLWEFDRKVELFEAETILIQAVLASHFTAEDVDRYGEEFNIEAFDLSGRLFSIVSHLDLLNSTCGSPFPSDERSPENFFEGKIMQHVYREMKKGREPSSFFCENGPYETFTNLRRMLAELGRTCGHVDPTLCENINNNNNNNCHNNNNIIETNNNNNNNSKTKSGLSAVSREALFVAPIFDYPFGGNGEKTSKRENKKGPSPDPSE